MKIKLFFYLLPLVILPFLFLKEVEAVHQLPSCASNYTTALELQEGESSGGSIPEGKPCYFFVNSKPGFELKIDYRITGDFFGSVSMYDGEREKIASSIDKSDVLRWLGNESEESRYYLVIENSYNTDTLLLNVNSIDRTDANSGTDAGGNFDKAVDIELGEYTGYLSSFVYGAVGGNDDADYYRLPVKSGDKITLKVSPVGDFKIGSAVYDSNRNELFNEDGLDLESGQIIQKTFNIRSNGYIYVVVKYASFGGSEDSIDQYTLLVSSGGVESLGGEIEEVTDTVVPVTSTKNILIKLSIVALVVFVIVLIVLLVSRQLKSKKKERSEKKREEKKKSEINKEEKKVEEEPKIEKEEESSKENTKKVKVIVEEGTDVEITSKEEGK